MNGPRVYWGRGLEIALKMFIIFNRGEIFAYKKPSSCLWYQLFGIDCWSVALALAYKFVVTSWMAAEQEVYKRQNRANKKEKSGLKYIHCHFFVRISQAGESNINIHRKFQKCTKNYCIFVRIDLALIHHDPGIPSFLLFTDCHFPEILLHSSLRRHLLFCHLSGKICEQGQRNLCHEGISVFAFHG